MADRHPGALIAINSAVGINFAQSVAELAKERIECAIKPIDWGQDDSTTQLIKIIKDYIGTKTT